MRLAIIGALLSAGCLDWESLSREACSGAVNAPDVAADYVIHRVPVGETVPALCSDAFWTTVPVIELEDVNPTNNTVSCRMVWNPAQMPGGIDVVYGCCVAADQDLEATYDAAARDVEIYTDDSFEYYLTLRPKTVDDTTSKIALNIRGSVWDVDFDDEYYDVSYDGGVDVQAVTEGTINDAATLDVGYAIRWRANVGFTVPAPHVAGCAFMVSDNDAGVREVWNAFGTGREDINDPTKWGRCLFSCTPPPAQ